MKNGIFKLSVDELFVDAKVQRDIVKASLNKRIKNFDINAIGVLIVSKRINGNYHILDGQHRWHAAMENGLKELDCEVHINLSEQEEAELFLKYNLDRVSTKPIDHFKIEVKAGVEISVKINRILKELNLTVSRRCIQSPGSLKKIHSFYGEAVLRDTLVFIYNIWGVEAMKSPMLIGVAYFISVGGSRLELNKFEKKLKAGEYKVFDRIKLVAEKYKVAYHSSANESYCQAIIGLYNKMYKDREKWVYRNPLEDSFIK